MYLPASFGAVPPDPPPPLRALREAAAAGTARKSGYGAFACTAQEAREALALNYNNIAFVDDAVGRVHTALRRLGLDDDTVMMFTSDHGDLMADHGLMLKGGLHYRALTRVPFIWRDTAGRRAFRRSPALAQTIDIGTSVLDRAGLEPANGMQGLSLLPISQGTGAAVRPHLLIEEEGQRRDFGLPRRVRMRSLLTPRHRLTLHADEPWGELYDLAEDPLELRNLWSEPQADALRGELTLALARAMMRHADTSPYPVASA